MIKIEEMKTTDLEEVRELWTSIKEVSFPAEFDTVERLTRFLTRNEGLSTIARSSNGKIVGAVLCGHDGRRGFFYHLGVDYDFRKQGIARKMVERSFEVLGQAGIDTCFLFTLDSNLGAQGFWKSMGFNYAPHIMYQSRSI